MNKHDPRDDDGALKNLLYIDTSEKLPRINIPSRPPGWFRVLSLYDRGTTRQIPEKTKTILSCLLSLKARRGNKYFFCILFDDPGHTCSLRHDKGIAGIEDMG